MPKSYRDYEPFGQNVSKKSFDGETDTTQDFTTTTNDTSIGLRYVHHRYLDSHLGRFISEDPIQNSVNWYVYCGNNPLKFVDPTGLFEIHAHKKGVGHVGMSIYGKAFDYGRYRGQYALSSGGRTITGPNVLKRRTVTHPVVQKEFERKGISRFKVNVPKELDNAIAKKFNDLFNKEFAKQFPKDIQNSVGQQLKSWDRYSGTDWTPFTDNCIRFTIDTIKETMLEYISQNLDIEGKKDLIETAKKVIELMDSIDLTFPALALQKLEELSKEDDSLVELLDYQKKKEENEKNNEKTSSADTTNNADTGQSYSNSSGDSGGSGNDGSGQEHNSTESDSSGDKIICVELFKQGLMDSSIYKADEEYGKYLRNNAPEVLIGYQYYARSVVKLMRSSKLFTNIVNIVAKPWTIEMAYKMGYLDKGNNMGKILMFIGVPFCELTGKIITNNKFKTRMLFLPLLLLVITLLIRYYRKSKLIILSLICISLIGCPLNMKKYLLENTNYIDVCFWGCENNKLDRRYLVEKVESKKEIKRILNFISSSSDSFAKCGYVGEINFYDRNNKRILDKEMLLSISCNTIEFYYEGRSYSRLITSEGMKYFNNIYYRIPTEKLCPD